MFYGDKIKSIHEGDKVLEIGPGASPFPRSDVFLEIKLDSEKEYEAQFGHSEKLVTDKPVIFYDGKKFPFRDNEFDYVICSHVLEHVDDVEGFLEEVYRVAPKGYFEYPTVYYEYLYNFDVHLNLVKYNGKEIVYMKKSELPFDQFKAVQAFFYNSLSKGHHGLMSHLTEYFIEGFEWLSPVQARRTSSLSEICFSTDGIRPFEEKPLHGYGPRKLSKELIKSLLAKF